MSNLCRSFKEPGPCARFQIGWQMSNTAKMPETWNLLVKPNPYVNSYNYRGMPVRDRRSCGGERIVRPSAGQDCPREYKKHKSRQKYLEPECCDYDSYGSQHSYCKCWEPCRYHEPQPPAPPRKCRRHRISSPPRRCYEPEPPAPHWCCCEQLKPPPSPPWICCYEDSPRPNCQYKDAIECRDKRRHKKRSCRRKKCSSCESLCVVTHEAGVQTEGKPPCQPDRIEIIDITTQEKEVRHRTGEVEVIVDEIQTVTVVPNDGSKPTKSLVQSRTSSKAANESQRFQTETHEEIDPSSIELPEKATRYSMLEPILANLQDVPSNPPSGYSSPADGKDRRVYRTNEKFEKENEFISGKQETETVFDNPNDARDSQPTLVSSASSQPVQRPLQKPLHAVLLNQPIEQSSLTKQKIIPSSLNRVVSGYNPKKHLKDDFKGHTAKPKASRMVENSEGKLVPKPRASDFSQLSTIHMKVTNRKEKLSQKAGRKSVHQDALFETKISELRLISPVNEEEPPPKPKPKRKKPKKALALPPPNDLICKMHRPIQRKKCDSQTCRMGCGTGCATRCATGCGAGGRSCGLPCIVPCSGFQNPQCAPIKTQCAPCNTQCDPIYGFGSHPTAYYCHR